MDFHQKKIPIYSIGPPQTEMRMDHTIEEKIARSQDYFLNGQHSEGYWWFELESNATITAEYLMMLRFMDLPTDEKEKRIVNYLLKRQGCNGAWSIYYDDGGELNATIESYFALKLAGMYADSGPLKRAREFIRNNGGISKARIFTKIFLALFGQYDWKGIPALPVEIILFPRWFPFTVYDFSSWSRATLIPLSILLAIKPSKEIPESMGVKELYANPSDKSIRYPVNGLPLLSRKQFFIYLDRVLKALEGNPLRFTKEKAMKEVETWILEHQDASGDWGGIQPAMVNSLLALSSLGYKKDHPVIRKGLQAVERFTIERSDELVLQSCISPVWDTALALRALLNSGLAQSNPSVQKGLKWMLNRQIQKGGDWQVKNPNLKPGGWAFEFHNDKYPDVDDSAVVLMALKEGLPREDRDGRVKIEQGLDWVIGMQNKDGGWASFDRDNNKAILNEIPFADLEAMLDPSTADVTGRVIEMMGLYGYKKDNPVVARGIAFIKRGQEQDGSWWGRWGVNYVYGTWSVLSGLASIREDTSCPYIQKALDWLRKHQNKDGGWGETCRSYADPNLRGQGPSTPSQTAWATLALMAGGDRGSPSLQKGILYLLKNQKEDGTWEENYFTGTGFPKYFFLKYHGYRNFFPLMALGRYRAMIRQGGKGSGS